MAIRYDRDLGMYQSDIVGGSYASADEARAAEQAVGPDTLEFGSGGIDTKAPDAPAPDTSGDQPNPNNPLGMSDNELRRRQTKLTDSATTTANINRKADRSVGSGREMTGPAPSSFWEGAFQHRDDPFVLDGSGNRVYVRSDVYDGESADIESQMGTVTSQGMVGGTEHLSFEPPAAPVPTGSGGTGVDQSVENAENRFNAEDAENDQENKEAWTRAWSAVDDIEGGDYGMSDEARQFQKEGLQQQRDLLKRTLGFDPEQYATQFADQGLARNIALARSTPGGAAAQQAGMFAAMEGAPAMYAEGARAAAGLETQRLNTAEAAAKAFGELGKMTRNSDENRAQFESNLTVEIADQVSKLTQGQVSLNQQESQMFAEMWMDFAQLQSVYAGMSSDEMIAWWQNEAQKRGQDKQLEGILASIKADGAVSSKDLIGGLFQLGGGILGAGGMIGSAYAGRT